MAQHIIHEGAIVDRPRQDLMAGAPIVPIVPRNINEVAEVARAVLSADAVPDSLTTEKGRRLSQEEIVSRVIMVIMSGSEVGLGPMASLANIALINKRRSIWGQAAIALIQSKGVLEGMKIERIGVQPAAGAMTAQFTDDFGIRVTMRRRGQPEPYVGEYTVGRAKRAHLWMNSSKRPWIEHPERQLQWRAFHLAATDGFSDCLMGLMIREVAEDIAPETTTGTDLSFLDDAPPTSAAQGAIAAPTEEPIPFEQPSEPAAVAPEQPAVAPAVDSATAPQGVLGGGSDSSDPKIHAKWVTWGTKATEAVFNSQTMDALAAAHQKISEKVFEYRQHIGDKKANELLDYIEVRRKELAGEKDGG